MMDEQKHRAYYKELKVKANDFSEGEKKAILKLTKIAKSSYYFDDRDTKSIEMLLHQLSEGEENAFLELLKRIVRNLLGEYPGDVFDYIICHKREYSYSTGFYRRPFRTTDCKQHSSGLIWKVACLIDLYKDPFSLIDYLTTPNYPYDNEVIKDILAYEIDHQNVEVITALKEIIYGENNTALLNRTMISGMFLSHQEEVYKMAGDLLIAARLQEGLRQSIVESMDEGTLISLKYMLKIVLKEDLIRYSSVVRALDVWTGLTLEAMNTRVAKQLIDYAYQCLSDEQLRNDWVSSKDINKLYMSLWATAVIEEQDAAVNIRKLMESSETYQKITAQAFLTQSQNDELRFSIACDYLEQTNLELQYYVYTNYVYDFSNSYTYGTGNRRYLIEKNPILEDKKERARQFSIFKEALLKFGKKEITFSSIAMGDVLITYSSDLIANKLLYLTAYDLDEEWIAQLFMFKDVVSTEIRGVLLEYFCHDLSNVEQRNFIFESLADKSIANREFALNKLMKIELLPTEVQKIETVLKLKTSSIRRSAIQILLKQSEEVLDETVERLLTSKSEPQRLAVLEMITELKSDLNRTKQYKRYKEKLTIISKPTEKEKLLLAKLTDTKTNSLKNGLGLFEPKDHFHILTEIEPLYNYTVKNVFTASLEKIKQFLIGLSNLIHEHRHYQYQAEYYDGYKETLLLGAQLQPLHIDGKNKGLDNFPLPQVWRDYINESNIEANDLLEMNYYIELENLLYSFNLLKQYHSSNDQRKIYLNELFPVESIEEMVSWLKELTYYSQISQLASAILVEYDRMELFPIVSKVLNTMIHQIPVDEIKGQKRFLEFLTAPWLDWSAMMAYDDQSFKEYFLPKYKLYVTHNFKRYHLSLEEIARAFQMNLIDEHEVYKELLIREESKHHLYQATSKHNDIVSKYPIIVPFREKILLRILEIELKRGDLPTEVTNLAMQIQYFEGIDYFVKILLALDKEAFVRGYIYGYGDDNAKKEVLSHLLKVCHPKAGDDEVVLKELLENKKLTEKRLLEAAMYAPQWIEVVAKLLDWKGLRKAAWYFHAHINESFSAEKETIVAHYSPISPEDFNDGAFDIEWFKQSYHELGEERFAILYDCAKYISAGANHRRSQLFADAILGKLDLETIKNSIVEKRNKNHLLCYSLIPVDQKDKKDVLIRYEFFQKFLRESQTFGAQRRATEAKVVMIALANLARNAGYKDVIRLTWDMEAQKMNDVVKYLQLKQLDEELAVQLTIEEQGKAEIKIVKNGKALKSVPTKYKKHDYIVTLKEVKTELKNQYIRAKEELERSMEMGYSFTLKELETITQNPVVAPIISALIFKVGEQLGFLVDGTLVSSSEERYEINKDDALVIAHPLDLYKSGRWSDYQRKLFNLKLKQPFKQVFRELYLPNEDELTLGTISHRYAGHQIQPRKTVALLKNRLWTVSYEEGLQKVYYKENIIAKIFAMADWLSPADVEAPTIEAVQFYDRQTYKSIDISNVPRRIFSEIMRDIDLVVSIAHVGGVDPEASLTTIEMRKAIIRESLRLMKLENVKLAGNFAQISGELGEYSVNLGSGMVFKQASGALYIVPVHSQHRGKIFLPFIDEDPKTAEVLSKIVIFAEDKKIKDPSILAQIK